MVAVARRTVCTCCLLALYGTALVLAGCASGISVRETDRSPLFAGWRASALSQSDLSPRTQQTLRQLDLVNLYRRNGRDAYDRLHRLAVADPQPDLLFALAEVSFQLGRDLEKREDCEAVAFYYLSAGYAYHYLFDGPEQGDGGAFDPRFRLACDLYNNGLGKCIRAAQRVGRLDPSKQLRVPCAGQEFTLSVQHHGFQWRSEEFGPLLFAADYEVVGLANHHRTYGLGVPLIGLRRADAPQAPGHAFYPREASFPVTAFFRFEGTVAELGERRAGRLELYNPLAVQSTEVAQPQPLVEPGRLTLVGGPPPRKRAVPLETDLTTPLAYFLSKTDLEGVEVTGFLRPDGLRHRAGIYLFEPYQPGKIPVLMVHGLFSSPLTWAPLFNDLRADPALRERFQFWFYLYPTGNPYIVTAADLRQSLDRLRQDLDPGHADPALDQMVFVGHSMGGLVSKLVTQDSGHDFWNLVGDQPFETLRAQPATRQELQRIFFFERESCVKRVVFLGTPHHGSALSPSPPAQLLSRLVQLPKRLMAAATDVSEENPGLWPSAEHAQLPTSIDLLSPGAPALELLAKRPAPPSVKYHSVIGVFAGHGTESTDGVVPYSSSHIDGAESELLVPAFHGEVHHHPRAFQEVRRILNEHLQSVNSGGAQLLSPR
jgi:pimeloyl-ACP methyl ester carboxylesterase